MKIAFFSWETLHTVAVGGVANHVTELALAMQRRGHEVHVFARKGSEQEDFSVHDGVNYHKVPISINPDFVTEMSNMGASQVWFMQEHEKLSGKPFDIVHGHDWMSSIAMVRAKNELGRTAVMTIHSTEYGRAGNVFQHGPTERIHYIEAEGLYVADHVISVSQALANETKWIYQVPDWKLSVVPNGIRCEKFNTSDSSLASTTEKIRKELNIGPMDPTVLFAGRLCWQKGPDLLLEAVPFILKHRPDAKFLFVGDGHMRMDLERRMYELGVSSAVRFLGVTEGPRLVNLFHTSDAVCVPSRNEPFGIVILEAWAAGKPVITTTNGGPKEIVTHELNGLHVFDYPGSIAWGICKMFDNFQEAHRMGRVGKELAYSTYGWDQIAAKTELSYLAALQKRGISLKESIQTEVKSPKRKRTKLSGEAKLSDQEEVRPSSTVKPVNSKSTRSRSGSSKAQKESEQDKLTTSSSLSPASPTNGINTPDNSAHEESQNRNKIAGGSGLAAFKQLEFALRLNRSSTSCQTEQQVSTETN